MGTDPDADATSHSLDLHVFIPTTGNDDQQRKLAQQVARLLCVAINADTIAWRWVPGDEATEGRYKMVAAREDWWT